MKHKGFTLLEILVVFSIIGIVLSVSVGALISARKTSRDAKRKTDVEQLRGALELYKADNSDYPNTNGNISSSLVSLKTAPNIYLVKLPLDPDTTRNYYYKYLSSSSYALCAALENSSPGASDCSAANACGNTTPCNYEVNNP